MIAVVGAESTGKSTLTQGLTLALQSATGLRCALVTEYLRAWCITEGRTPRADEQAQIAAEQTHRIEQAAQSHDVVICDTSALMTAIYSQYLFGDSSLIASGQNFHRRCALTLLTALDLPWVADGLQRDGAHVRKPIDTALRAALLSAGLNWAVVAGSGSARLDAALNAITPLLKGQQQARKGLFSRLTERQDALPEWRWACENCDVPECEHLAFKR